MDANYKLCYVAFLDILGFKNIVTNWACEQIAEIFSVIQTDQILGIRIGDDPVISAEAVKYYIMSDSIVVFIDADCQNAFSLLTSCVSHLQETLCNRENPVFLRGAIVKDYIYHEGNVIFGPAVTKAYLLSEKNAKYPRIIMTKELFHNIENDISVDKKTGTRKIKGDVYEDCDEWICVENPIFNFPSRFTINFLEYCQNCIDTSTDDSVREKYLYLKRHYLETIEKNKQWEKNQ